MGSQQSSIEQFEQHLGVVRGAATELGKLVKPVVTASQEALREVNPELAPYGKGIAWPLTYDSRFVVRLQKQFMADPPRPRDEPPEVSTIAPRPFYFNSSLHASLVRGYMPQGDRDHRKQPVTPHEVQASSIKFIGDLAAWGEAMADRGYDMLVAADLTAHVDKKSVNRSEVGIRVFGNLPGVVEYFQWRTGELGDDTRRRDPEIADVWASKRLIVGARGDLRSILPQLELRQ